jgi:hypothetical protein
VSVDKAQGLARHLTLFNLNHPIEINSTADSCAPSVSCCVRVEGGIGVRVGVAGHDLVKMTNRVKSCAVAEIHQYYRCLYGKRANLLSRLYVKVVLRDLRDNSDDSAVSTPVWSSSGRKPSKYSQSVQRLTTIFN